MHSSAYSARCLRPLALHLARPSTRILLALGAAAALLHALLRFPLHVPGHHGLEWMALLVVARRLSTYRGAACVAACGAALTALFLAHGLEAPAGYLLSAAVLDLAWNAVGERHRASAWALVPAAALAHAAKGALVALAVLAPAHAASHGFAFLLAMHALFGAAGGLAGALLPLGERA